MRWSYQKWEMNKQMSPSLSAKGGDAAATASSHSVSCMAVKAVARKSLPI